MPLYEYDCRKHGVFEQLGSIADRDATVRCPECKQTTKRVLSPTQRPVLARGERIARERNERSQHEPRIVSSQNRPSPPAETKQPPARHQHAGGRPWMIGH